MSASSSALGFAAQGFKILPQNRDRKKRRPLVSSWAEASCDGDVIRGWAKKWPHANFAVLTGPSGLLVLDIDTKNDRGGMTSWARIIAQHGEPNTLVVRTPSDGRHVYFRRPPIAGKIANRSDLSVEYPGIEVKGDGGCVTLPGSFFNDGGQYTVVSNGQIAACPQWLVDVIAAEPPKIPQAGVAQEPPNITEVWRSWVTVNFPEATWSGDEAQVSCPFHDDATPSCSVNVVKQSFYCHAAGCNAHGGIMKLAAQKGGIPPEAVKAKPPKAPTQAVILVRLCDDMEFFACDGVAYATVAVESHKETWPLRTTAFRDILAHRYYRKTNGVPNATAVEEALTVLRGKALWEGKQIPVRVRIAGDDKRAYLDLGDPAWRCVEVTAAGWQIIDTPPHVRFRRPKGLQELPAPERGGTLLDLVPFLNCANVDDLQLIAAWLVAACRPNAKYPVLGLTGEQGSGKSTVARRLRQLIDPNLAMLRASPREEDDLIIAAHNGWAINLDNVSHIPAWLSDGVCRLSTGAGWAKRQLYTDAEETIFMASRPVIMNGIADLFSRGDLLDRSIIVTLPGIPESGRRLEKDMDAQFNALRPRILGGLLDAVSTAMQNLDSTIIEDPPRMADFAQWVSAAAPAMSTTKEEFLRIYRENRILGDQLTIEASLVAMATIAFIGKWDGGAWRGSAGGLLDVLTQEVGEKTSRSKEWPKSPRALAAELRRVAPALRKRRIDIEFEARKGDVRPIRVTLNRSTTTCEAETTPETASSTVIPSLDQVERVQPQLGGMTV